MEKDFKIFGDKNFSDLSEEIYEQMKKKVSDLINDSELEQVNKKELMNQIIGES